MTSWRKTEIRLQALIGAFWLLGVSAFGSPLTHFITAHDGKLFAGTNEFRFLSFDVPNLLEIEDNVGFTNENPWRLPDAFEINDALATIRQFGGTVTRTYVITVKRPTDAPDVPRHVLAPGKFDEQSFRALDEVLAAANRNGVRLIIPLVDNWPWMGGRAEYAGFRGKSKDDFWTDPQLIADFEQTIHFVLTRTNTITGVRYADDPAILCWETGNEVASPVSWTRTIAHYIKSLDTNHLVMDGFAAHLREAVLAMPDVDIVTTHHYPGGGRTFAELIRANAAQAKGRKAYIVGEFGFAGEREMENAVQAIVDSSASGGLLWSLRFRDRDGGFYWHSESAGGSRMKAFHWPGSPIGNAYNETTLLNFVRTNAWTIRGLAVPEIPVADAPRLLPIADAAAISWQGSVGATLYQVERAAGKSGPWRIIATNVDEAMTQYRPQFADETVPVGKWYYRVRARNGAGRSEPSNVVGPVTVKMDTLVDELVDFSRVNSRSGNWKIASDDCRATKEDAFRAAGVAGSTLVYQLPTGVAGFRVFAFFPKAESGLKFSVSADGEKYHAVVAQKESYFHGAGDYGYWMPVEYHAEKLHGGSFLKIELTGETQISRIEIIHPAPSP